jgi:hypothetical protein
MRVVALAAVLAGLACWSHGWRAHTGPEIECPNVVQLPSPVEGGNAGLGHRKTFSVATYNVEFLFDGVGDGSTPRSDPFDAQVTHRGRGQVLLK